MAQQEQQGDYRKTEVYKDAGSAKRRSLERYKAALNISDEQMFLLLALEDLRALPKEKKRKGNAPAETMVCGSVILFLAVTATQQSHLLMLIASILVFISAGFYFSGVLNPYSNSLRRVKKQLKAMPAVQPFEEWLAANPEPLPTTQEGGRGKKNKK